MARRAKLIDGFLVLASLLGLLAAAGCANGPRSVEAAERMQRIGPAQITPAEIQSQIMSFADTYAALVDQATTQLAIRTEEDPAALRRALKAKMDSIQAAVTVAAGANPVASMLDLTVLVTLQRETWANYWIPQVWGDAGQPMLAALVRLEEEIWEITSQALSEEERRALRDLITQIRNQHPDLVFVESLRASEFARDRQQQFVRVRGGGSLLSLFQLDPLAGLSPTTREFYQARLLGERAFFFAKRLPNIIRWQSETLVTGVAVLPETQSALASAEKASDAAERAAATVEELKNLLPRERAAAIDQAADRLRQEREAAIDQAFDRLGSEREAIFSRLDHDQDELRGTLGELRAAIDSATRLSDSLGPAIEAGTALTASIQELKQREPDEPPFNINEFTAAMEAASETIRELEAVLGRADELATSPIWQDRKSEIQSLAAEGRTGVEGLIDRVFYRSLIVAGALSLGLLAALALARLTPDRVAR